MTARDADREPVPEVRQARYFLYVLGGAFVALGFALEMVPALAAVAPVLAGRAAAGIGALILSFGRFGPHQLVQQFSNRLRGR